MQEDQPGSHRPWSQHQVRVADSWPARRDQAVSVALSPTAEYLAWSVGQRLNVAAISGLSQGVPPAQLSCASAPGLAWSPRGDKLAFRDSDSEGRVLDLSGGLPRVGAEAKTDLLGATMAMAFSPEGYRLATLAPSLPGRMTLTLLGPGHSPVWEHGLARNLMSGNRSDGVKLAWSPNGRYLACTTGSSTIWLVDAADGSVVGQFDNHSLNVTGLSWINDDCIVSASKDATLQLWRPDGAAPATVVETIPSAGMVFAHAQRIALIWSAHGELCAWSVADVPTQLWFREPPSRSAAAHFTRLVVSAVDGLLAMVDAGARQLLLVSDWARTPGAPASSTTYANAKVLLLGDSGVGKSALAMVLAGEEFRPTESTHGRRIWHLPTGAGAAGGGQREVLVWDLAGQPGYRIVHQLHLGGAALALILFDSRSETTPLAGVRHWARAVRHAHPVAAGGLTTLLVAARTDRGVTSVSPQRIDQVMKDFALDGFFETSALEGTGIAGLRSRMLAGIDWERIPTITSTALFAAAKQFVVQQKTGGNLMTPLDELGRAFQAAVPAARELLAAEQMLDPAGPKEDSPAGLAAVFEGCVARLDAAGLVKRLKFGDYMLLQPELLDDYASAIVNAARNEPDGLGSIPESRVTEAGFPVPITNRVPALPQERLLVLATLEELIQAELVLREHTEDGTQLVFPSAYRRDLPVSEAPTGDGVVFQFEGPVDNVYATLIVRLTRSNVFTRVATWQSAARFAADTGECTVSMKSDGEGKAELWIGYDAMPDLLRKQFERFIHTHLDRRANSGTVTRERQYSCPHDNTAFTPEMVRQVRNLGRTSILCPVCERRVPLRDDYEPVTGSDRSMAEMDASADAGRERDAAAVAGTDEAPEFDVFLCHNWDDKPAVRALARQLQDRGLRPWLDENELRPGMPWQRTVEEQIQSIPAAVVIVGSQVGPWQDQEMNAFLRQFTRRNCPVIPVLLPGAERPELPMFLDGMTWVDLAQQHPDPLDLIVWGITGRHPNQDR